MCCLVDTIDGSPVDRIAHMAMLQPCQAGLIFVSDGQLFAHKSASQVRCIV